MSRGASPPAQRLMLLLQMAVGEAAPMGPAADRAKSEALRLVRSDEVRADLAKAPERMGLVRDLIQKLSAAA